ncbi:MAG: hypothetical protein GY940_29845 [bacterium]|nr:hypothetical protein [bacterium]
MLSKIVSGEDVKTLELQPFHLPTQDDIQSLLEEKKRESQRDRIINENKDDPVQAAKKEANAILIDAQEKLKAAEAEATVMKNRKEKEIRTKLEKEFQAKLEEEIKTLKQNFSDSLEDLGTLKQVIYKKSENQLMQMVFSITRKVIGEEVKTSPEIVLVMLKKGFEKIKGAKEFEIKINPVDYETLAGKKGEVSQMLKAAGNVKFTKDEQVEVGGCQIVTELGEISSEPGKQLDIIMRELSNGA